jgi:hypothetical protein
MIYNGWHAFVLFQVASASKLIFKFYSIYLKSKDMYSDDNKANEIIRRFISYVDAKQEKPSCILEKYHILLGLRSKRSKMPFFMLLVLVYGHKASLLVNSTTTAQEICDGF